MFAATALAGPLLAGNTVVIKPSEATSLSALRLAELVRDLFPPGVVNIVTGLGTETGDRLVRHPEVRRIAFTGSVEVGRGIQRAAAEVAVKVVSLELGGKNPLIVFPDADLDAAVEGALRGMNLTWQGQSCGSTSRLFIHRSIRERFLVRLGERMNALVVGDPRMESSDVGAVVSLRQFDRIDNYIQGAIESEGARLWAGGPPDPSARNRGLFVRPTLVELPFDSVTPAAREEIFGPVLVAMPFSEYEEVVEKANSLGYGLTASVWTKDLSIALRASRDLEAGYVWVNWSSTHVLGTAFGGVKDSGVGREEDIEEIYSYSTSKNVYVRF
jgi:acyl-CoA reductase-like NAD-dependent aldehyde dehydrogenase